MEFGAALPDDDVARYRQLAAEQLDAQALGLGIATVAAAAARFFVCHVSVLLNGRRFRFLQNRRFGLLHHRRFGFMRP